MDTAKEFQRRRRSAIEASKYWVFLGLIGMSVAVFFGPDESATWTVRAPSLLVELLFFCIVGVGAYRWQILFRCPQCDELPSTRFGLKLDPDICPSCGVPLK